MDIQVYDVIAPETAQLVKASLVGQMPVTIHINSPGGSVTDALAIYSSLRKHGGRVTAIIDGLCASAATIVAMAADEIVMAEHSLLMVHNPWTVASGDAGEMRKTADALDKAGREMAALYAERTGLPEDKVSSIMGAETWFNAYEAVDAVRASGGQQRAQQATSCRCVHGVPRYRRPVTRGGRAVPSAPGTEPRRTPPPTQRTHRPLRGDGAHRPTQQE